MKILFNFPQVNKAVVQGSTAQYVVDYGAMTCTCPDHIHRRRRCKHIAFVLDELVPGLAASPGIECDGCNVVKPESAFAAPGHTAGGSAYGYDIDSCLCTECALEVRRLVHEDLAKEAEAEMAAEDKSNGGDNGLAAS